MAITLGANIPSYSARMQLNRVSDGLSDTFKKLSSGSKINSAGDDAAGLVISQNMQAKITGSKQAMHNIQTAKSFLMVAEDGMVSISDHLQRINDLLTNMANDTNDIDSRTAAIREVIERLSEINRLAESTNFNGMNMLDGSVESIVVQIAPEADESISTLNISDALSNSHTTALGVDLPEVLDPDIMDAYYVEDSGERKALIPNPNSSSDKKYVYAKDGTEFTGDEASVVTQTIIRNPNPYEGGYIWQDTASADIPTKYSGSVLGLKTKTFEPNNENCRKYMANIQAAIAKIATNRGLIGAYENRMDSSYESLTSRIESLEEAKVPYTDTDIAQEATNLTQRQILEQINVAVLANANQGQQMALSLLG